MLLWLPNAASLAEVVAFLIALFLRGSALLWMKGS